MLAILISCHTGHALAGIGISAIGIGAVVGAYAWASKSLKQSVILAALVVAFIGGAAWAYAGDIYMPRPESCDWVGCPASGDCGWICWLALCCK